MIKIQKIKTDVLKMIKQIITFKKNLSQQTRLLEELYETLEMYFESLENPEIITKREIEDLIIKKVYDSEKELVLRNFLSSWEEFKRDVKKL